MTIREILNLYEYYNQRRQQLDAEISNCNEKIISIDDDIKGIPEVQYTLQIPSKTENMTIIQHPPANDCETETTHENNHQNKGMI